MSNRDTITPDMENNNLERTLTADDFKILRRLRTLEPADYEAQYFDNKPVPRGDHYRKLGNPSALGISVFAVANTMIALFLLQVRGIAHSELLVGVIWFVAGVGSWLTAIMELYLGNTFAWCVFGSFGGYYFSFACVFTPAFGIADSYPTIEEYHNALGIFWTAWGVLFFIFLVCSLKTNLIFVWIFSLVDITVWLLAAGYFQAGNGDLQGYVRLMKAGGGFLLACTMGGWYLLLIQLTESLAFGFKIPIGSLTPVPETEKKYEHIEGSHEERH